MHDESTRTRIPASLSTENPFFKVAELELSLRQMLTLLLAGGIWFGISKLTDAILPVASILSLLLWSWILIAGIGLALIKKNGRPYEEYLSQKFLFLISPHHWAMVDPTSTQTVEDAQWDEDDSPPPFSF